MAETTSPRHLKLFCPTQGGLVRWEDIGDPLELQDGMPVGGESLVVRWKQPDGSTGEMKFYATHDIFLEDTDGAAPPNSHPLSNVPDCQLLACCSMAAILAGEVHPGTYEFLKQVASDQNDNNFETILGEAKLKSVSIVEEADLPMGGTPGLFYDIEFQRTGQGSNTKTVRSDIVNISKYSNRSNIYDLSVSCVPGAVTREFGKKTVSDLGAAGSQLRNDIVAFVEELRLYA